LQNNEIAIIGGAGFVGTRLAMRLDLANMPYKVCDIEAVNSEKNYIYLDVENTKSLESISGAKAIINLAAVHRDDARPLRRYYDVNVQGALNVCDAARREGINKIIFTSSVAIYGFAPPDTDEKGTPNYFNDYGRTKYLAEQIYQEWLSEDPENRTLVIIRPTVIFGEANRGNVYNLLKQIASKRFIMFGVGKNKKSMAYVENVAAFLEFSLSFKPGLHIYNYIDKPDLDMNNLVTKVRKTLFGKNNPGFRLPGFLGIIIGYFADLVTKIIRRPLPVSGIRVKKFMGTTQFASTINETGFVAPVSLEDGLAKTLKYEFLEDNSGKRIFNSQ
tara:strand:+ start:19707 stop:20699 length:993 start_codon:yes stop_codon:yes gene_type:complete